MLILACCLTGCGRSGHYENPYRVDTVIQIPVDPTDAPAEPVPTDVPTEPEETAAEETQLTTEQASSEKSSGSASTGTKTGSTKSSGKSSGATTSKSAGSKSTNTKSSASKDTEKATEPPATEPAETESAQTRPPATEPPATEPPATEPPETQPPTQPSYDPAGYAPGALEYEVFDQINLYREEAGVAPLSMDAGLCAVASVRAFEISSLWSHTRPDGRGYATVLSDYGYGYGAASENLIYVSGSGDAEAMVAKWMSNEKNKSTLLSESFTVTGIGIYRSGAVTYLANLLIG